MILFHAAHSHSFNGQGYSLFHESNYDIKKFENPYYVELTKTIGNA